MLEQEGMTLAEILYSGSLNGELFFDEHRKMKYHIEKVYGDGFNLGSTVVIVEYEDGKSKFIYLPDHLNDQQVLSS